jgi:hypothetical protein
MSVNDTASHTPTPEFDCMNINGGAGFGGSGSRCGPDASLEIWGNKGLVLKIQASEILSLKAEVERLRAALTQIRDWPGNLPDSAYERKCGTNEGIDRGLKVVTMRSFAASALSLVSKSTKEG